LLTPIAEIYNIGTPPKWNI